MSSAVQADATDEGWGCNVRQMHWAETGPRLSSMHPADPLHAGNYGVVPNPAFENAFVATAHDLGEPWDDGCKTGPNYCCVCSPAHNKDVCGAGPESTFDPITKFPWIIQKKGMNCGSSSPSTPQLMGGIHPSTKAHVGARLAQAAWSLHYGASNTAWTGPVVEACGLEHTESGLQLRVRFNSTLLSGDNITVKTYNSTERASATFVRVGKPLPVDAYHNYLYANREPWWGDDSSWEQVDIKQASNNEILLDLSNLQGTVTGVKYGHGIPGMQPQSGHRRVCCGTRDVSKTPCPPDNCPISAGGLPAMPFMASVTSSGSCAGIQPQVISGL